MAFPVVEDKRATGRTGAETTSPVNYPVTVSSGALLVCIARVAVAGAVGWPSGWNELVEDSSDASDDVSALAWKAADGTEGGTTFSVTHSSGKSAYIVYSITGAENPVTQPPELSTVTVGTDDLPDPGPCTPTGGAKDYLWLWLGCWEGEQTSPPAGNPGVFINPIGASSGTAGQVYTNAQCASAQYDNNIASLGGAAWTISASDAWTAWTMAVHPAGLTAVGDTVQQIWNIRIALGDTNQHIWNIRATLGDTVQPVWNVRTFIGDTVQGLWNVRTAIGKAVQKLWNIRAAVAQTRQAIWNVRTFVGDTVQPIWNVLSSVTAVGDIIELRWHVRAALGKAHQAIWNVRTILGDTVQSVWNVYSLASKSVQPLWNVPAALGKSVQQLWNVCTPLGKAVQYIWDVLSHITTIGDVVQIRWKVWAGTYHKALRFSESKTNIQFGLADDSLVINEVDSGVVYIREVPL